MDDQKLNELFTFAVREYLELNGEVYDANKHCQFMGEHGVDINKWEYATPQPSREDLKRLSMMNLVSRRKKYQTQGIHKKWKLPSMTTGDRDTIDGEDGMMILNSSTNRVECFYSNQWNPL